MVMADSFAQLFCDYASREEKAAVEGAPRFHPIAEVLSTLYNGHLDITYYCKGGCGLGHFLYELRRNPRFLNGGYDFVEILWYGNELFHVVTLQDGTREKRYRGDSARVENNFRQICFLLKTCCPRPWIYLLGGPEVFMCDMRLAAAIIKYSSLARSFGVGCASGAPYIKQMQERPEKYGDTWHKEDTPWNRELVCKMILDPMDLMTCLRPFVIAWDWLSRAIPQPGVTEFTRLLNGETVHNLSENWKGLWSVEHNAWWFLNLKTNEVTWTCPIDTEDNVITDSAAKAADDVLPTVVRVLAERDDGKLGLVDVGAGDDTIVRHELQGEVPTVPIYRSQVPLSYHNINTNAIAPAPEGAKPVEELRNGALRYSAFSYYSTDMKTGPTAPRQGDDVVESRDNWKDDPWKESTARAVDSEDDEEIDVEHRLMMVCDACANTQVWHSDRCPTCKTVNSGIAAPLDAEECHADEQLIVNAEPLEGFAIIKVEGGQSVLVDTAATAAASELAAEETPAQPAVINEQLQEEGEPLNEYRARVTRAANNADAEPPNRPWYRAALTHPRERDAVTVDEFQRRHGWIIEQRELRAAARAGGPVEVEVPVRHCVGCGGYGHTLGDCPVVPLAITEPMEPHPGDTDYQGDTVQYYQIYPNIRLTPSPMYGGRSKRVSRPLATEVRLNRNRKPTNDAGIFLDLGLPQGHSKSRAMFDVRAHDVHHGAKRRKAQVPILAENFRHKDRAGTLHLQRKRVVRNHEGHARRNLGVGCAGFVHQCG
jgi:hypothetical protein